MYWIKKCIPVIFLSLLVLGLLSCGLRYEKELEDNGTIDTAMSLQSGRSVKAITADDSDIDFYRIVPGQRPIKGRESLLGRPIKGWDELLSEKGDVVVSIALSHSRDLDLMIRVMRGNRTIKVIDDSPNYSGIPGEESIANLLFSAEDVEEGRALLAVERVIDTSTLSSVDDGGYTLSITLRPGEADEEREPNDKPVLATPIGDALLVRGYFDPARNLLSTEDSENEVDWFSFEISESWKRQIVHISLSAVPNVDSRLSLFDELGYLVRAANSNGIGEMERLMSVGLLPGSYYVKVESDTTPQKNAKVGYLLRVELSDEQNSEYEPNDRYIFANDVEFSRDIYGYFNPLGDVDWYRMSLYEPDPQVLSIKISPTEDIDPVIELYKSGEELIRTANDRGVDEGEIIKNIGTKEGIYYIKVYNQNPERDNPERRYTLVVDREEWQEDEEFEVNDFLEEANEIIFNGLKRGYISPRGDRDVYTFNVAQGPAPLESAEVTLELSPCVLLDLAMRVYNEQGVFLEEINNNPAEEGEKETLFLDEGTYFVEVISMNQRENARDAYILRIY